MFSQKNDFISIQRNSSQSHFFLVNIYIETINNLKKTI